MLDKLLHNCIKGFACLAIALFVMANKPCFAEDRLLIGSYNSEDKPVQLVVANPNNPMSSVLTTGANQTVSAHSGNQYYNYLSGGYLLDYFSYCGLDFLSTHSAKWFYDNNLFVNYSGRFDGSSTVTLTFLFAHDNFVSQPIEWQTLENTGDQVFYDNSFYFYRGRKFGIFSPCWDNAFGNSSSFVSGKQYFYIPSSSFDGLSSGSAYSRNNNSNIGSLYFSVGRSYSSLNDFDISALIESFIDSSDKFLCLQFKFTLAQYNDSVSPSFSYSLNCCRYALDFPLSSSFYEYNIDNDSFYIYASSGGWNYNWLTLQFIHRNDSLAAAFPFYVVSGALAYESDFTVNPSPTPTPFPTYAPWDPDNPSGGSTPTPIPPWRDSELPTPTPYPSVSTAPIPTGIVTDYIPLLDLPSSENTLSNITGIIKEFNAIFSRKVFALGSYTLQLMYYFSGWFKFIFIVPAGVFVAFLIGRLRKK